MSFRLAAYAVCIEDGQVLLARWVPPTGESHWTLPGGRVEHGEDPFDQHLRTNTAHQHRGAAPGMEFLTRA